MHRKTLSILALLLVLCLLAGCDFKILPDSDHLPDAKHTSSVTEESEEDTSAPEETVVEETVPETTAPASFTAYDIVVRSPKLAVYSGPGYSYEVVDYITDQGKYTIVAHASETLGDDEQTTWGKLQSEEGWINLDDAFAAGFEEYLFKIQNPCLEIYSGPGYSYDGVDTITDQGTYTIVEESVQYFTGGRSVTWGKLKSGVGWICLDDAVIVTDLGPPYRCTECGRADVYISRYALCDECYNKLTPAPYGTCINCGEPLTYEESCKPWGVCDDCPTDFYDCCTVCGDFLTAEEILYNDGIVCDDCLVCGWCGSSISIMDVVAFGAYYCQDCYEDLYCCGICGKDCYYSGTIDGMCEDCYNSSQDSTEYCTTCGTELHEGNTAYNGFGQCEDCYYATLDPEYICDLCGADCSYRGVYDGLCEDCYEASQGQNTCDWCGDPITDGHSCSDGTDP